MIHSIVFDMGQVLIQFCPDLMIERLGVPPEDRELLRQEVFSCVEWVRLDRGTISEEDAVTSICRRLPASLHHYARELVFSWWKRPLIPVEGMAALIAELKGLGYGIYLLSNANYTLHRYFPQIPGSEYFDGKIVSADWKLLKPEHELYEVLFREYKLKPEECFFIDDLPPNIEAANRLGMSGTVFRGDVARLRRELVEAGVHVKQ
jgi:putative hydrolase of the HAD superfamily